MSDTADNKRTDEQNSIALEQEEVNPTAENNEETETNARKEQPDAEHPEHTTSQQNEDQVEQKPAPPSSVQPDPILSSEDTKEPSVAEVENQTDDSSSEKVSESTEGNADETNPTPSSETTSQIASAEASDEVAGQKTSESEEVETPVSESSAKETEENVAETKPASPPETTAPGASSEVAEQKTSESQKEETPVSETSSKEEESHDDTSEDDGEDEDLHDDTTPDYSHFSKKQLTEAAEALLKETEIKSTDRQLNEIKTHFDEIEREEYNTAFDKFVADGGEKDGFAYKTDNLSERFHAAYKKLKERKAKHFADLEAEKESNLQAKQTLLEKLRNLVDNEETNQSISQLKALQTEWKAIGPAPRKFAKSLWASYNALVYRFYDNISIYYELKELDRKKNLEAKIHLCERAEGLSDHENIKEAIKELDALHEEYKHIGPVPKEEQEPLWDRFKAASDVIHSRRREYVDQLKEDLQKNLESKLVLSEKVQSFSDFDSDSIKVWNEKTKEIRELQGQWEAIGGIPRDQAKEVNKTFWASFKKFFTNKSNFFKKLDSLREENLKKKEELVAKAAALKESTDWKRTASELKQLQQDWKEIGPVPEKQRESIYKKFKAACDEFFNNRRASFRDEEKDYEQNLKAKEAICEKIEQMAAKNSNDIDTLVELNNEYQEAGFVPKKSIKSIQKKYEQAVDKFLANAEDLDEREKQEIKINLKFSKLKNSPNAQRKLGNQEMIIRKQISKLEDDLSVWKNNLNFFADSKKADKLKEEFGKKIEKADEEVKKLKQQLRVLRDM